MSGTSPNRRRACLGALLAVGVGLACLFFPPGAGFVGWSYDLAFRFRPAVTREELRDVVIVYMDEKSFKALEQPNEKAWDRTLHANLLDWLKAEQCRLVVLDTYLAEPGSPEKNRLLADAMSGHGRVLIAALPDSEARAGFVGDPPLLPRQEFLDAAARYGVAGVDGNAARTVRRHYPGTKQVASLPWAAARAAGAKVTAQEPESEHRFRLRWMNYYGPYGTLDNVSYCEVTNQPPGFFRNKVVFVGGRPRTAYGGDQLEQFRTPYTTWDGQYFAGVEIMATTFLNLMREDWLTELNPWWECALIVFLGTVFGLGLSRLTPTKATIFAGLGIAAIATIAISSVWLKGIWFPWMIPAVAQIPCAWLWCVFSRRASERLKEREGKAETIKEANVVATVPSEPTPAPSSPLPVAELLGSPASPPRPSLEPVPASPLGTPGVSDHELLRRVGKGAYGEVWLARNAIGRFHAVKIIRRSDFEKEEPYEREFRGIQKFMPISLGHANLVRVLHVGRNDAAGYFFYIMEVADDEQSGPNVSPATYVPRTLSGDLQKQKRLSVGESVELGLQLTSALEYLHQKALIHRDIKPGNIIYAEGVAKIADIGLVTELRSKGQGASYLGTEGYIAPEGPGTAAADVYSLGKVLYEASMGRDRNEFPDMPTSLIDAADSAMMQLNKIILKACEVNLERRYTSAGEMRADLLALKRMLAAPV